MIVDKPHHINKGFTTLTKATASTCIVENTHLIFPIFGERMKTPHINDKYREVVPIIIESNVQKVH